MYKWVKVENEYDNMLDLHLVDDEKNVWKRATVKWDGCIHLYSYDSPWNGEDPYTGKEDEISYTHICRLDYEIEAMIDMRKEAIAFFGETWEGLS